MGRFFDAGVENGDGGASELGETRVRPQGLIGAGDWRNTGTLTFSLFLRFSPFPSPSPPPSPQDAHIISPLQGYPGHCLYAVFDGHGGKNAAKYAADKGTGMVAVLLKLLATQSPAFDPEAAGAERVLGEVLRQAFLKVDEEMRRGFDQVPDERSGCTAIAVLVTPTHIITANAGDSRALLSRNSQNVPLSEDHKPWLEGEKKRIEDAGGCVSMKRVDGELAVSRSLGDFQFKMGDLPPENFRVTGNPDLNYQVRNPQQDQFLVLACDGIWDVMCLGLTFPYPAAFIALILAPYFGVDISAKY